MNFHFHVFGVAILDVLGTIAGAWWFARLCKCSFWIVLLQLLLLGTLVHHWFNIDTPLTRWLYTDSSL
jgi:hypothetical protein